MIAELRALGLEIDEDDTGAVTGSTIGNLLCRLPGRVEGGTPIFLCAHLDTVPPQGPLEPVVGEDGIVRNAGGTILGADNKSAVAAMIEAARRIVGEGRPHAGVELLFTSKEEVGLIGAGAFDISKLEAELGFVYDQAAPIGDVIMGAPYQRSMLVRFHGRPAHSGMVPEEGRSAIAAASRAIADLRLGRIDEETTANVGLITGGSARNIIPEWCELEAEARSHDGRKLADLVQEMLDTFAFAASTAECTLETEVSDTYQGYRFKDSDPIVQLAAAALERCGYELVPHPHGRRRRRERLQHEGAAVPEPCERDDGDPHRRRAHRGGRPRRDGRGDPGAGRRRPRCQSALDAGRSPRSRNATAG